MRDAVPDSVRVGNRCVFVSEVSEIFDRYEPRASKDCYACSKAEDCAYYCQRDYAYGNIGFVVNPEEQRGRRCPLADNVGVVCLCVGLYTEVANRDLRVACHHHSEALSASACDFLVDRCYSVFDDVVGRVGEPVSGGNRAC